MIRVRDLHKSYRTRFGTKTVLEGVDLDLRMGERLGILGRNGAGKSTMVRLVSGAEKPSGGRIERSMSVSWPLAFGGAFQPQLTGIDNIRFVTSIYDQDFERNLAFVEEFAELGPYLREPVRSYSSGMRARLAFAISMIIEFDCFLIDEIGAVGDARFHDRCNYELFEVRGDRAMIIISHDASYLRDHCNRWAILHEGRLSPFDDFDHAYDRYRELIGADTRGRPAPVDFGSRARMIDSSQRAALTDERFRALVQQGDWARDQREWARAEAEYRKALDLYPYQRSYWTQLGHVAKEQERYASAEIAYRTAIALGEPAADVAEHANFVIDRQAKDRPASPVRAPVAGPTSAQPPARPDVAVLARLFDAGTARDDETTLALIRDHDTLDALANRLLADERAGGRLREPGPVDRLGELERANALFGSPLDQPTLERLAVSSRPSREAVASLASLGAFEQWPLTASAIASNDRYGYVAGRARIH